MKITINQPTASSNSFLKTFSLQIQSSQTFNQFCFTNIFDLNQITVCEFCQCDITFQSNVFVYEKLNSCSHHESNKCKQYCWGCFARIIKNVDHKQFSCYHARHCSNYTLTYGSWRVLNQILLLDAIQKYGMDNWTQISQELYSNRFPVSCKEVYSHYFNFYLDSQGFEPFLQENLLNITKKQFNWKNLLESSQKLNHLTLRKDVTEVNLVNLIQTQYESASSTKYEEQQQTECEKNTQISDSKNKTQIKVQRNKKTKTKKQNFQVKIEQDRHPIDIYFKDYIPNVNDEEYTYYLQERQEFQWEYNPFAECIISDLQFNDNTDTQEQRQLKLNLLKSYNQRLKERIQRRKFAVQHKFLDLQTAKQKKTKNAKKIFEKKRIINPNTQKQWRTSIQQQLKPFTRFFSLDEIQQCQNLMINTRFCSSMMESMKNLKNLKNITGIIQKLKKMNQVNNQGNNPKKKTKKCLTIYKKEINADQGNINEIDIKKIMDSNTIQKVESQYKLLSNLPNKANIQIQISSSIKIKPLIRGSSLNF